VTSPLVLVLAGAAIGLLYGLFGVGGAFATPLLALFGVPALAAVASPLPALLPGAAAGAGSYARSGLVDWRLARRTLIGAVPACVAGAFASRWVGGTWLLVLSGAVLVAVGVRVLAPVPTRSGHARRQQAALTIALGVVVGFLAGLLANGGGFLLVPLFLLALGLALPEATATALVVVSVLSVPALVTHTLLGDIDWSVAAPFALGLAPAAALGAQLARRVAVDRLRVGFGVVLAAVGAWMLYRELRVVGIL
jgi:uncharacterized membrane protein YfcA